MHWVDTIATELGARQPYLIASGTSISGQIHLGNAGDVIIADGIARALKERGHDAKVLWIMDDMDPLRSAPPPLPPEFANYLGIPDCDLPCPFDCCSSFVHHFTSGFISDLEDIGIRPEVISSARLYRSGKMDDLTLTALKNAGKIRQIFREISGSDKPSKWLPFLPICACCGRIATTFAYDFDPGSQTVKYVCMGGVAGKKQIQGCGHEGEASIREGKMVWRVEWAARWKLFQVVCEPFGKEHAAAGGSYDTSSVISREVFGYEPPYPVPYEHILVGGKKMAKSLGNVITLREMINLAGPEVTRFFFFRTKATKHKEFSIEKNLIHLIERYEWTERIYFGVENSYPSKELEEIRRSYELSQVDGAPDRFFQVPYTHLLIVVQLASDWDGIRKILSRTHDLSKIEPRDEERLRRKVAAARYFVRSYLREDMRIHVLDSVPELSEDERVFLIAYADEVASRKWTAEDLHDAVYVSATALGVPPKQAFITIYKAFLGRDRGPRLGYFLSSLDRDFVLKRLRLEG